MEPRGAQTSFKCKLPQSMCLVTSGCPRLQLDEILSRANLPITLRHLYGTALMLSSQTWKCPRLGSLILARQPRCCFFSSVYHGLVVGTPTSLRRES